MADDPRGGVSSDHVNSPSADEVNVSGDIIDSDAARDGSTQIPPPAFEDSTDGLAHEQACVDPLLVAVEAFGSGVVLHAGLAVSAGTPVGDLRRLIMTTISFPPRTRTVRLFVGHGGAELDNDVVFVAATPLMDPDPDNPLVVFPVMCT